MIGSPALPSLDRAATFIAAASHATDPTERAYLLKLAEADVRAIREKLELLDLDLRIARNRFHREAQQALAVPTKKTG